MANLSGNHVTFEVLIRIVLGDLTQDEVDAINAHRFLCEENCSDRVAAARRLWSPEEIEMRTDKDLDLCLTLGEKIRIRGKLLTPREKERVDDHIDRCLICKYRAHALCPEEYPNPEVELKLDELERTFGEWDEEDTTD